MKWWRLFLIVTAVISVVVSAVELIEIWSTGTTELSVRRLVRMELSTAAMSVWAAWWLGWRLGWRMRSEQ